MRLDYLYVASVIALIWGGVWAAALQFTAWGRFLALRRTWVTVCIGVGGDICILYFILPLEEWFKVAAIIVFSSVFIIYRSLHNEERELSRQLDEQRENITDQD